MNENIFRILAGLIFFTGTGISSYFRRKADKETGESVSRKVDGSALMYVIRIGGLVLWLTPIAYLINPLWLAWAKLGLPEWARWLGVVLGVFCTFGIYWLFSSIGSGITPTSATRKEHQLSTSGPYRYIRHPLYTFGTTFFISFGLMTDLWIVMGFGILTFIVMAIRTPREEANLVEKFGDEYQEYMKRTGRYLPKLL
ncbi:MAG TPA: isoprenylcysteine carboxylmethyltransferase family protein [Anaerolineales bacterium]